MPDESNPTPPVPPNPPRPPFNRYAAPAPPSRFVFEPMDRADHPGGVLDALLKHPGQVIHQLHQSPASPRLPVILALIGLLGLACYGLLVGSFSGREQWWAAPLKIVAGTFFSSLICLPSLYIFACLSGARVRLGPLSGALAAAISLQALLLLGFTPVVWVFSQSTNSLAFMGTMHLFFWWISLYFGLRLITGAVEYIGAGDKGYLKVWLLIFVLVSLQMTTALRPILGRAPTFLPTEKRFFLAHWLQNIANDTDSRAARSYNPSSPTPPQTAPDAEPTRP